MPTPLFIFNEETSLQRHQRLQGAADARKRSPQTMNQQSCVTLAVGTFVEAERQRHQAERSRTRCPTLRHGQDGRLAQPTLTLDKPQHSARR